MYISTILYFLYLLFIASSCGNNFKFMDEHRWLEILLQNVVKDIRPYQLQIFINKSETIKTNYMLHNAFQKISVIIVDLSVLNSCNKHLSLDYSSFVIIVLKCNKNIHMKIRQFLSFYENIQPNHSRPQCLLILFDKENRHVSFYEKILKNAWSKKFLNFSILKIRPNGQTGIYLFNPFFNSIDKHDNLSNNSLIFPDKLTNTNGYEFRLLFFHYPPYINVTKNGTELRLNSAYHYNIVATTLSAMNFSIVAVDDVRENMTLAGVTLHAFDRIKADEANMMPIPTVFSPAFIANSILYLHLQQSCLKFVVFVPILSQEKINTPWMSMIYIIIIPIVFILVSSRLQLLMKFSTYKFKIFDIFRILFGFSANVNPKFVSEKMLVLSMLFVSIMYATDFISVLLESKVVFNELELDSIEKMDDSQLRVYSSDVAYKVIFTNNENEHIRSMEKRTTVFENQSCIHLINKYKRVICFASLAKLEYEMREYKKLYKTVNFRLAKPEMACPRLVYGFEKASPYIQKISEIFQRIYESGIYNKLYQPEKLEQQQDFHEETLIDKTFLPSLGMLLKLGYLLSLIAFVLESIIHFVRFNKSSSK